MSDQSASSPVIRKMVHADLDRIVEIDVKVLGKQRPEYWEMKLGLAGKRAQISSLVAESEGTVVGFIIGGASRWEYGVPENIGWIDTIGVDPDFHFIDEHESGTYRAVLSAAEVPRQGGGEPERGSVG